MNGRLFPVIAVLVVVGAGLAHANFGAFSSQTGGESVQGTDDAYISFRYARNIVGGLGAVYNPGERVEGYSNPLFILLTIPGFFVVRPDAIYWWSVALNAGFMAASVLVLYGATRREIGAPAARVAAGVLALSPLMWAWIGAGLETPLVLFLQLSIWAGTLSVPSASRDARLSALAVAAVFARPDGFIVPVVAAAYEYWRGHRASAARLVIAIGAATVVMTGWRFLYYGDLLPNTYYAKVDGALLGRVLSAAKQLLTIGGPSGLLVIVTGLCVLPFLPSASTSRLRIQLSTVMAIALIAYWAYIGGDVFDERFLLVLFPLGIFEALRVWHARAGGTHLLLPAVALIVVQAGSLGHHDDRFAYATPRYDMWVTLGLHLRHEAPDRLLAIDAAGKVPYFSGLRTIDMLGLTNRVIARSPPKSDLVGHLKFSPEVILDQRPDLVAAWVATTNLDLDWGLTRDLYTARGYQFKYLVNASRAPRFDSTGRSADILDVRGWSQEQIASRVRENYRYAVLHATDTVVSEPPASPRVTFPVR